MDGLVTARVIAGLQYDYIIRAIDWQAIITKAMVEHLKSHPHKPLDICGECVKTILLRMDE